MGMRMSMAMSMSMSMGMGMGMSMGMSMGKDSRMGEGAGQSTGVAASRQAAARSVDQHSTHISQSGQGHKSNKTNEVVISQRDNSPEGESSDFGSRSRGVESRMGGSTGAGARSSVLGPRSSALGYLVRLKRHFFSRRR